MYMYYIYIYISTTYDLHLCAKLCSENFGTFRNIDPNGFITRSHVSGRQHYKNIVPTPEKFTVTSGCRLRKAQAATNERKDVAMTTTTTMKTTLEMRRALVDQWASRVKAQVEFFCGAMAMLEAMGYEPPAHWVIQIMTGREVTA